MLKVEAGANVVPFRRPEHAKTGDAGDLRFRSLLGERAWAALPAATRARFGKRVDQGHSVLYAGDIVECRISRIGWLLGQALRLIGAPLPLSSDEDVPASVCVTEDASHGGQFWTRIYGRRRGFPQVIHSSKRFAGPTGLEEYVGCGFGIALRCEVADEALHFISDHYFVQLAGMRVRIPHRLAPGRLRVSHVDCNRGWFAFALLLEHRWLGELIRQTAMFHEVEADR
jgi:hypothetical protein